MRTLSLVLAAAAFARDHTSLNGTWAMKPAQSEFAGQPVLQTGTVTINEREGNITVSRNFVYTGATQTYYYQDSVDSRNNDTVRSGKDVKTKAKWDHDVLNVTTTQSGETTLESYSLEPDGDMTVRIEKAGHPFTTLIFERK